MPGWPVAFPAEVRPLHAEAVGAALIVSSSDGSVTRYDARTGAEVWRRAVSLAGTGDAGLSGGGFVLVGGVLIVEFVRGGEGMSGIVTAFCAAHGNTLWERPSVPPLSGFIARGEDVVACVGDGVLVLEAASGRERWIRSAVQPRGAVVTEDGSRMIALTGEPRGVEAYDCKTGDVRWRSSFDHGVNVSIGIGDGVVYAADFVPEVLEDGPMTEIRALSVETGKAVWARRFSTELTLEPQRFGDVVMCCLGGVLTALRAGDGAVAWRSDLLDPQALPASQKVGGLLLVSRPAAKPGGVVFAIDPSNGRVMWERTLEHWPGDISPASGGLTYVLAHDVDFSAIVALDVDTGSVRWTKRVEKDARLTIADTAVYAAGARLAAYDAATGAVL